MPFTPFHPGAGAVFKATGGRHFSFMVFGGTQVLMDLEPAYMLLTGGVPGCVEGPVQIAGIRRRMQDRVRINGTDG